MKFKVLHDIDSEKVWVATSTVESDYPVYIFVRLMYWDYYMSESEMPAKYGCEVIAASPGFGWEGSRMDPKGDSMGHMLESNGITADEYDALPVEEQAYRLVEYGMSATLWNRNGDNNRKLIDDAMSECYAIGMLFGCYADKSQNAIGDTGWDFMRGHVGRALSRIYDSEG